jgi:hypothetical protein
MLLILIPIAWLAVLTLCVAICRAAARGDAARSRADVHSRAEERFFGATEVARKGALGRSPSQSREPAHSRSGTGHGRVARAFHFASSTLETRSARLVRILPRRPV